jgi:hypothetical protein
LVRTSKEEQPSRDAKKAVRHSCLLQPPATSARAPPWVTMRELEASRCIHDAHPQARHVTRSHVISYVRVRRSGREAVWAVGRNSRLRAWLSGQEAAWAVGQNSHVCARNRASVTVKVRSSMWSMWWGAKTSGMISIRVRRGLPLISAYVRTRCPSGHLGASCTVMYGFVSLFHMHQIVTRARVL